jgi:hypothetical protein|nr:MAG TPA_asm: minor capsid protein [Caudoviricetes sp.]
MYDDEKLEELRKRAAAIAEPIWETLLRDIVRRVRGAGGITSTAEYQIYRAEQLGLAEKAIKAAIAEQLKISDAAIDMLFEELKDETVLFEENAELRQLVEAYGTVSKKASAADYEGLWAPGPDGKLYTVKEAYGKIMDFAWMQTATGTYDFQTAVREATKKLLERGLRVIPGKDGRSYRLEYAVRSYITNRMGEMFNAVNQMNYDAIGADGWEISAHPAPAPDHALYQGRQYSKEEYDRINNSLARKFGWWNCRHLVYPIRLGVSPRAYSDEQLQKYLDDNEKGVWYNGQHYTLSGARDRKRQLESLISQTKYDILAAEGDEQLLKERQIRLQNQRREYERFCRETGQEPENWRTMVAAFGRSEASKAAWAARKLGMGTSTLRAKDAMRVQLSALTEAERAQLTQYTGFDATAINSAIRHGRINAATREKIAVLDSALVKGTVPNNITLYRETSLSFLEFDNGAQPDKNTIGNFIGQTIPNRIFTSTSFRQLGLPGRDTVIELHVPAGYQGALYIRDLAHPQYKLQDEVLFARGLKYRLLSVDTSGDKVYIKAEVIKP